MPQEPGHSAPSALRKQALRRSIRAHMRALSEEQLHSLSREVCGRLFRYLVRDSRLTIACYMAMPHEVQTAGLIEQLHACGKRVVLPRISAEAGRLEFYVFDSVARLQPGRFGILEPAADARQQVSAQEIELACVPGVAFDRKGSRLGQGGGYFDRLLAQWGDSVTSIGLALNCQIVEQVPAEAHDRAVAGVMTESGWLLEP